jgi:hypothetical protein
MNVQTFSVQTGFNKQREIIVKKIQLKTAILASVAAAAFGMSSLANANLLTNGGFEQPGISNYQFINGIPGWQSNGPVELWNNRTPTSYEGFQHLELNSTGGGPYSISQSFDSVIGTIYDVSFAHRARSGTSEQFSFYFGDTNGNGDTFNIANGSTASWTVPTYSFMATSLISMVEFTAIVPATGTIGNFLDAVSVTDVPEPGTLALLGLGIAGLGAARRRQKA